MPRKGSYRRSQIMKQRRQQQIASRVVCGTGSRNALGTWPFSAFTKRRHKLVIPAESPDKKFVLLVGDSHLRAIANGHVKMPDGYSFGVMSTAGAGAVDLWREVQNAVVPRKPDVVCLLAPSNDLTTSRTVSEVGEAFGDLLTAACRRWRQVVVLDFPPRLNVPVDLQNQLRQEFHRVADRAGVKYVLTAVYFPLDNLKLWIRDGVHLSDHDGMVILAQLFWVVADHYLNMTTVLKTQSPPRTSPPAGKFSTKITTRSRSRLTTDSEGWTEIPSRKRQHSGESDQSCDAAKWSVHQQVLRKCSIPLTHVRSSGEMLAAMDAVVPSHLPSPADCIAALPEEQKVEVIPSTDVSHKASQTRVVLVVVKEEGTVTKIC